jgi:hypothetical protein
MARTETIEQKKLINESAMGCLRLSQFRNAAGLGLRCNRLSTTSLWAFVFRSLRRWAA